MKGKKDNGKASKTKAKAEVAEAAEVATAAEAAEAAEAAVQDEKKHHAAPKSIMQTQVSKLRDTLKLLQSIVPKKSNLEVLKNVLIKDGKVIVNNLDVMVSIDYPEATGQFLIPYTNVRELLKFVPGNETLTIQQGGKHLKLSWDSGKASYDVLEPADYPAEATVEEKMKVFLDGDRLIAAMMSVVDYCVADGDRPVLKCVNVSIGENIDVAAADGFRLAYQVIPVVCPVQASLNIPASIVQILGELWNRLPPGVPLEKDLVRQIMSKRLIELVRDDNLLMAKFGLITMVIHLVEGQFPNYRRLIPEAPPISVRFFAPELERAVLAVKMISKEDNDRVFLEWSEESMTVAAGGGPCEGESTIKVQADSPGKIAVNQDYLLEYLVDKEGLVSLGITSSSSPLLLRHGNSPIVVIMPKARVESTK
jgi:DNA polymerase-3 subunit beta